MHARPDATALAARTQANRAKGKMDDVVEFGFFDHSMAYGCARPFFQYPAVAVATSAVTRRD